MSETTLVTGAAGLIGARVVAALAADGVPVVATDLSGTDLDAARAAGAEIRTADLTDLDAVRTCLRGVRRVVHCAAVFDHRASRSLLDAVNVYAARSVAEAAAEAGVEHLVHLSSVAVYGRPERVPAQEMDRKAPVNPYDITKWQGEEEVWSVAERTGLAVTVLRPSLVYGPGARYGLAHFLALLAWGARSGWRRLRVPPRAPAVHFVHIDDVVQAVVLALANPRSRGRAFNVADASPCLASDALAECGRALGLEVGEGLFPWEEPWADWATRFLLGPVGRAIARPFERHLSRQWRGMVARGEIEPELAPRVEMEWLPYTVGDHFYSTERLASLGFVPRRPFFPEGLRETVDWYLSRAWIPAPRGERAWRLEEDRRRFESLRRSVPSAARPERGEAIGSLRRVHQGA